MEKQPSNQATKTSQGLPPGGKGETSTQTNHQIVGVPTVSFRGCDDMIGKNIIRYPILSFFEGVYFFLVRLNQVKLSCGFGLVVWVFLITLYFDQ